MEKSYKSQNKWEKQIILGVRSYSEYLVSSYLFESISLIVSHTHKAQKIKIAYL